MTTNNAPSNTPGNTTVTPPTTSPASTTVAPVTSGFHRVIDATPPAAHTVTTTTGITVVAKAPAKAPTKAPTAKRARGAAKPKAAQKAAPKAAPSHVFFFTDHYGPDDLPAVACGDPGISGQYVTGKTHEAAMTAWEKLYAAGDLKEEVGSEG